MCYVYGVYTYQKNLIGSEYCLVSVNYLKCNFLYQYLLSKYIIGLKIALFTPHITPVTYLDRHAGAFSIEGYELRLSDEYFN